MERKRKKQISVNCEKNRQISVGQNFSSDNNGFESTKIENY